MRKKKPVASNKDHFFCFNSTVSYTSNYKIFNIQIKHFQFRKIKLW